MSEPLVSSLDDALSAIVSGAVAPTEAGLVDELEILERIKAAASARQARAAVALDAAVRTRHREAGLPARRVGDGVAAQVALARRVSPAKGARLLGLAKVLHAEMPYTFALMSAGEISEWRATILARETACLELADRCRIDRELCSGEAPKASALGEARLEAAAKKLAYELDPEAFVRRAAKAEADRHVTIRPAPDTMVWLTALLPVKEGVGAYAMLRSIADSALAAGDPRSRGQVMADALVDGVLALRDAPGVAETDGARRPGVDLRLVMTDQALFDPGCDTPAYVIGYGPVPAEWARAQAKEAIEQGRAFLKRLYVAPATGRLAAMDSRSRRPPPGLAEFVTLRDGGICRTPGCNAPVRNLDHLHRHADGGETSERNLAGTCERCNQAREAPGWRASPSPDGSITVTTPTGHTYTSPAADAWAPPRPRIDIGCRDVDLVLAV